MWPRGHDAATLTRRLSRPFPFSGLSGPGTAVCAICAGTSVAIAEVVRTKLRVRMPASLFPAIGSAISAHQRLFVAAVVMLTVCLWAATTASAWFLGSVVTGLPD